ncbi:MAG: hypothetical protein ACJAY5_001930 [Actinomycetes bacterium]|jgi:hypothetical protein
MSNMQPEDRGVASGSNMALRLAGALFGFAGGLALVNFFDNQVLPGFDLVSGEVASSVDLLIIGDVPKRVQVLLLRHQQRR